MLLKLYYLYDHSPKKCRELEVVSDLKTCITFDESGIWASGSRWVGRKLSAMKHVLSKYSAYTSHFIALSEDHTVKAIVISGQMQNMY